MNKNGAHKNKAWRVSTCVLRVFDGDHGDDAERQVVLVGDGLGVDQGPVVLNPLVPVHVVDDALGLPGQETDVPCHCPNPLLVELELVRGHAVGESFKPSGGHGVGRMNLIFVLKGK